MVCLKGTEAAGWAMQQDTGPAECLAQRGAACAAGWEMASSSCVQVLLAVRGPAGSLGSGTSPRVVAAVGCGEPGAGSLARDRTSRHCSRSGGSDGSVAAGAWLCV